MFRIIFVFLSITYFVICVINFIFVFLASYFIRLRKYFLVLVFWEFVIFDINILDKIIVSFIGY
jgi:hypothetical protein